MIRPETRNWRFALTLALPIIIFFGAYLFNHSKELIPTGFIQYDNVSYIAYARQYLDVDSFHVTYSNPFNDSDAARIYFQPQTLFFAALLKLGVPPGWILIVFTILCSVVCFRLVIAIYDLVVAKNRERALSIWFFAWGGGILVLAGAIVHLLIAHDRNFFSDLFRFDPEHGWWGLNLGRSLFFSCEAYYHALFLGCMYCLLRKKWMLASIWLLVLVLSHPFTGIELLGIVCTWIVFELILDRNSISWQFSIICAIYLAFYICYYFVYLQRFPEHRSVAQQYSLNWRLGYRMVPAYCIVATLAIVSICSQTLRGFFQLSSNRLFACWFMVALLLANHEWFMKPRQPIHFTRGYIWTSLFLLGVTALQRFQGYARTRWGTAGLAMIAALFFLDNFSWVVIHVASKATQPGATFITYEQKNIFNELSAESTHRTLLISNDPTISYLSTVYTNAYPWMSHPFTTPFAAVKRNAYIAFFETGKIDSSWLGRNTIFALKKTRDLQQISDILTTTNVEKERETENYLVLKSESLRFK